MYPRFRVIDGGCVMSQINRMHKIIPLDMYFSEHGVHVDM